MFARIIIMVLCVFAVSCTNQMTRNDARSLKNVAVINTIEDKLYIREMGLTVFEDFETTIDISDWNLSQYLTEQIIQVATEQLSQTRFVVPDAVVKTTENRENLTPESRMLLLNLGFDAVLIAANAGVAPSNRVTSDFFSIGTYVIPWNKTGFLFFTRSVFGNHVRGHFCLQHKLSLIRLEDGKALKKNDHELCRSSDLDIEIKPESGYTPTELIMIRDAIKTDIDSSTAVHLPNLFFPFNQRAVK